MNLYKEKILYFKIYRDRSFLIGFTQLENFITFNLRRQVSINIKKISFLEIFKGRDSLTGFTLIEVLIVIAIMLILMSSGASLLGSRSQESALDASTKAVVDHISKARNYAATGYFADAWGVKVLADDALCFEGGDCLLVFKGTDYASRDSAYDSIFDLKNGLSWASNQHNEFYFSKVAGWLSTTTLAYEMPEQSMVLVNTLGAQKTVSTTPAGLVYYGD